MNYGHGTEIVLKLIRAAVRQQSCSSLGSWRSRNSRRRFSRQEHLLLRGTIRS